MFCSWKGSLERKGSVEWKGSLERKGSVEWKGRKFNFWFGQVHFLKNCHYSIYAFILGIYFRHLF
jgi:hypothetical protein